MSKPSATQKQHRSLRRMPLFQPERFLHALLPWLRFAFHPAFVYPALVAVVLLEVFCSIKAPVVLARFLPALQHNLSIPLILLFAALIYAFLLSHELAHGLACNYFGGSVPEIGITWRTFCPVIYCKIDDVVLFQSRWQRVYTAFAGLFTNLLMLIPFAIWWWLSPPASLAWVICTFVLLVINFLILLNAIPLGDFDGYLMLKYALNILDLREQALQMGIQAIKHISFKQVDKAHTHKSLKNRKAYIVYILLCVFSIIALLTYTVFLLLHL